MYNQNAQKLFRYTYANLFIGNILKTIVLLSYRCVQCTFNCYHPVYFCLVVISSLLFGNLFVHFEFADAGNTIPDTTRYIVYGVLSGTGILGTLLIIAMRKPSTTQTDAAINRSGCCPECFSGFHHQSLSLLFCVK